MDQLFLLFFFFSITTGTPAMMTVFQTASISAVVGDTVTLECSFSWNETINIGRGYYKWFKGSETKIELLNDTGIFRGRVRKCNTSSFFVDKAANIELVNVKKEDFGLYVCSVSCGDHCNAEGSGTWLNEQGQKNATSGNETELQTKLQATREEILNPCVLLENERLYASPQLQPNTDIFVYCQID